MGFFVGPPSLFRYYDLLIIDWITFNFYKSLVFLDEFLKDIMLYKKTLLTILREQGSLIDLCVMYIYQLGCSSF